MVGELAALLPRGVVVVEAFTDGCYPMWVEEAPLVAQSTVQRRAEFATTRGCARAALAELGCPPVPILRGPGGAPAWPDGTVGTLTHCAGYRAAAVAPAALLGALGADAEPHEPLPQGVASLIASAGEQAMLAALSGREPEVCWDRVLFCVKEAVYKAWFPQTLTWLNFADVTVSLAVDGTFRARLTQPVDRDLVAALVGRWAVGDRVWAVAYTPVRVGAPNATAARAGST